MTANSMTYLEREPLSLMPAPGWRAIYIHDDVMVSADDLIGLAVYMITEGRCIGSNGHVEPPYRAIQGVVWDGSGFSSPEECDNFWRYLPPNEPIPGAKAIEAELVSRRTRACPRP